MRGDNGSDLITGLFHILQSGEGYEKKDLFHENYRTGACRGACFRRLRRQR